MDACGIEGGGRTLAACAVECGDAGGVHCLRNDGMVGAWGDLHTYVIEKARGEERGAVLHISVSIGVGAIRGGGDAVDGGDVEEAAACRGGPLCASGGAVDDEGVGARSVVA